MGRSECLNWPPLSVFSYTRVRAGLTVMSQTTKGCRNSLTCVKNANSKEIYALGTSNVGFWFRRPSDGVNGSDS